MTVQLSYLCLEKYIGRTDFPESQISLLYLSFQR